MKLPAIGKVLVGAGLLGLLGALAACDDDYHYGHPRRHAELRQEGREHRQDRRQEWRQDNRGERREFRQDRREKHW